jgi:hypothetical protein
MKNRKSNLKDLQAQWAEDVLNSLEGIKRAESNPYLYTKITARIEAGNSGWEKVANWISRPAFAFTIISVFVGINITVLTIRQKSAENEMAKKGTVEQMLAGEFSNTPSYSLIEINEEK